MLNGTGSTHVSAEKRKYILEVIKKLGFHPDNSAQTLRRGYSSEFAIFFPAPYNSRIANLIGTIHEKGLAGNCVVTQYSWNSQNNLERKNAVFQAMLARRPLGVFCSLLDLDRADIDTARASGIDRILVLDGEHHTDLVTFYMPFEEIGRIAAAHLLELGHRHMALIRPIDKTQSRIFNLRYRGMMNVVSAVKNTRIDILDFPKIVMGPSLDAAKTVVTSFLSLPKRPTAIYAYNDDFALPLMRALHEAGFRIPQDIAVLGTDDLPYGELSIPSLSTIRFDEDALGERAIALINSLITGEPGEASFLREPEPHLIRREST